MIIHPPHRAATQEDAAAMTRLVNIAGEGLPLYLWEKMAAESDGLSAWEIGEQRAQREAGGFSYRNTVLRIEDDVAVAALIGYPIATEPDPDRYDGLPAMFVPLQQLEDLVTGSWYINVLATLADFRGRGMGSDLLRIAERLASEASCDAVSLIVNNANEGGRRLYARHGYQEVDRRPIIKENWAHEGTHWLLLNKAL